MKKSILLTLVCLLALTMTAGSAFAESIIFSNAIGAFINFNGNDVVGPPPGLGTFNFTPAFVNPGSPQDFNITSSTFGTSNGDVGWIQAPVSGYWTITGPITSEGAGQQSPVSGVGNLIIRDQAGLLFTASLQWVKIETNQAGNAGNLNDILVPNLTNISYSGSEFDLLLLRNLQPDTADLTFIYGTPGETLIGLTTDSTTSSTGYQGTVSGVPVPPSALLLGSGLLGLVGWRRFAKS